MSTIESELLKGDDGRTFLKLFDESAGVHIMLEIDELGVASLAQTLESSPMYFNSDQYGSDE